MIWTMEEMNTLIGREFLIGSQIVEKLIAIIPNTHEPLIFESDEERMTFARTLNDFYLCDPELLPEIPEGFTRWFGDKCPVESGTLVEVINRKNDRSTFISAGEGTIWKHANHARDVIAYRIIPEITVLPPPLTPWVLPAFLPTITLTNHWRVVWGNPKRYTFGSVLYADKNDAIDEARAMRGIANCEQVGVAQAGSLEVEIVP